MSSSVISSLLFAEKEITIYLGTFILIVGVIGGLLNIIVFLSLRTFRQSSCAFYLTIMSIVNIGQMLTGLLGRIMISGFGIDWTQTSLFFCKFRYYCFQLCLLISMSCICLSTIDQYLSTCNHTRWRQWNNIKLARRLSGSLILFWIVHNLPFLIYFNHIETISTGRMTCMNSNRIFQLYLTYGVNFIIGKIAPIFLTLFFGFLAYRNVQQLSHRTLPLVRRQLDKQLTIMVLILVVFSFFTMLPYTIVYLLATIPQLIQNSIIGEEFQFSILLTTYLVYIYFASPFYIFVYVSNRFRRQLIYVVVHIYFNQRRRERMAVNQVMPQI